MSEKILLMIKDILENIRPEALSLITMDIAQVLFAGVVVEPIISHSSSKAILGMGLIFSFIFWSLSIYFNNRQKI